MEEEKEEEEEAANDGWNSDCERLTTTAVEVVVEEEEEPLCLAAPDLFCGRGGGERDGGEGNLAEQSCLLSKFNSFWVLLEGCCWRYGCGRQERHQGTRPGGEAGGGGEEGRIFKGGRRKESREKEKRIISGPKRMTEANTGDLLKFFFLLLTKIN